MKISFPYLINKQAKSFIISFKQTSVVFVK